MTGDEHADQGQRDPVKVVSDVDDDREREVVEWLNGRVPQEVPLEVAAAIRSSMAAALGDCSLAPVVLAGPSKVDVSFDKRRWPSLGTATLALIVLCMGLNVVVAWRNDRRIAAVVGDHGRQSDSAAMFDRDETMSRKMSVAALFEFNVSLIQRELDHERIEPTRTGIHERRRSTGSSKEKTEEEIPDRSGAAVRPGSGVQRVSKLAGWRTA